MKGLAIGFGSLVILLVVASFVIISITSAYTPVRRTVVSIEGKILSFVNRANLLVKTLNASMEFTSQRSAYDLGKTGGGFDSWNNTHPSMADLERELEIRIAENMPSGKDSQGTKITTWEEGNVDVYGYVGADCGTIETSKCFFAITNKSFRIYDESISSQIYGSQSLSSKAASNYFKLLAAGRKIMTAPAYIAVWSDKNALQNLLALDFGPDIRLDVDYLANSMKISVWEECLSSNEYYCVAPTMPPEAKITHPLSAVQIQYDYIRVNFSTAPECSDGLDNDGDHLVDSNDPGCHSDRDPTNAATYDPYDSAEFDCYNECDILFYLIRTHFGAVCGDANYDKVADIAIKDGRIDIFDIVKVGTKCSTDSEWCINALNDNSDPCP